MKWTQTLTALGQRFSLPKGLAVAFLVLTFVIVPMSSARLSAQLSTPKAQSKVPIELQEGWSFKIENYAIKHQGQAVIDVEVSYDYVNGIGVPDPRKYPDFVPINNFIQNFLVNYPNETDFWEILNKNLVTALLTQPIPTPYGVEYKLNELLDSITVKIDVEAGAANVKIPRSSIVTGSPKRKQRKRSSGSFSQAQGSFSQAQG